MQTVYKHFKHINNKGTTLVEVVISLVLVGSILITLMEMAVHTIQQAKLNESRIIGANYANYALLVGRNYCIDDGNFDWKSSVGCTGVAGIAATPPGPITDIMQLVGLPDLVWTSLGGGSGITYTAAFGITPTTQLTSGGVTVFCQAELTAQVSWTVYGKLQTVTENSIVQRDICK